MLTGSAVAKSWNQAGEDGCNRAPTTDLDLYKSGQDVELKIEADIKEFDYPDVLIIDGVYCMRDDEAYRSSWEDIKGIVVALKGIAVKYDCLIYATNQSNKEGAKLAQTNSDGEPPPYWSVAYGYDFARMVDFLVVMGARSNDDSWRKVVVPLARSGPSFNEAAVITFSPDSGDIGAKPSDVPADSVDNFEW